MQHLAYLGALKRGRHKDPVTVRVIRKWIITENTGDCAPLYVAMVLADAKVWKLLPCFAALAMYINTQNTVLRFRT